MHAQHVSTRFADAALAQNDDEVDRTLGKIAHLETLDLVSWVDAIVPNWVTASASRYAEEYSILQQNWENLCRRWGTTPKRILIVKYTPTQQQAAQYRILWALCNQLTRDGYVIRVHTELDVCESCGGAMLSKAVLDRIRTARAAQPNAPPAPFSEQWTPRCRVCREHNQIA